MAPQVIAPRDGAITRASGLTGGMKKMRGGLINAEITETPGPMGSEKIRDLAPRDGAITRASGLTGGMKKMRGGLINAEITETPGPMGSEKIRDLAPRDGAITRASGLTGGMKKMRGGLINAGVNSLSVPPFEIDSALIYRLRNIFVIALDTIPIGAASVMNGNAPLSTNLLALRSLVFGVPK
ncbi:hypothetical protein CREGCYN_11910 [Synechococcus sp. M16CYN]